MSNSGKQHDCAWSMATVLLEMIAQKYREEEQREIFAEFYKACLAGLEAYSIMDERQAKRLCPSKN